MLQSDTDGCRIPNFRNFWIRIRYWYVQIFSDMDQELKNQCPLTSGTHLIAKAQLPWQTTFTMTYQQSHISRTLSPHWGGARCHRGPKIPVPSPLITRDDHYPVYRLDIRQDSEFATGYGYPKAAFKQKSDTDPVASEISDICEISDLLLFFGYFVSQNKELKSGNYFLDVCCAS